MEAALVLAAETGAGFRGGKIAVTLRPGSYTPTTGEVNVATKRMTVDCITALSFALNSMLYSPRPMAKILACQHIVALIGNALDGPLGAELFYAIKPPLLTFLKTTGDKVALNVTAVTHLYVLRTVIPTVDSATRVQLIETCVETLKQSKGSAGSLFMQRVHAAALQAALDALPALSAAELASLTALFPVLLDLITGKDASATDKTVLIKRETIEASRKPPNADTIRLLARGKDAKASVAEAKADAEAKAAFYTAIAPDGNDVVLVSERMAAKASVVRLMALRPAETQAWFEENTARIQTSFRANPKAYTALQTIVYPPSPRTPGGTAARAPHTPFSGAVRAAASAAAGRLSRILGSGSVASPPSMRL